MSQFAIRDGKNPILDELKCQTQLLAKSAASVTIDSSCDKPVFIKDCQTQDVLDSLDKIYDAVDGLELTTENINLNAEQINLNTDEVESLLTDIKDYLLAVPKYNTEEQFRVTGTNIEDVYATDDTEGQSYTLAKDTYHSIAITVEEGIASITVDGKKHTHKSGYTKTFTATELYSNDIVVSAVSDDAVVTITTIS